MRKTYTLNPMLRELLGFLIGVGSLLVVAVVLQIFGTPTNWPVTIGVCVGLYALIVWAGRKP